MLYTRYGDEIFIDSSGNIGLGRNNSEPQYPLDVSGSIYTSGTFITDISNSAPLLVHSSIRVNNLNVEYLDNQSSSYYRNVDNINSGILNITYGGIGTTILGVNKLLIGDGSNPVISSNNLTWNDNQLDVSGNLNFTGDLYKNGQLYVNSQWGDGSNNKIYYNLGNVGIGTNIPNYTLDVSGNLNFGGNLYQNGVLFEGGGAGQWEDSSNNKIYYNLGNVGIGTSNPTRTLDISGDLIVNNLTVRDEWFIAEDTIAVRNQLQLQPILKLYYLSGTQSTFDISLNGYYDILPNNVGMYLNGTKLLYYDTNNKEYDVSVNHNDISYTEITISVYTPTQAGDILDVTIYPTFPNDVGTRYPGYVYQVFNQVFNNASGIGTAYTYSNLGIGTTIPTQNLDVSGNTLVRGTLYTSNIDFSGNLYQNGALYISSQWSDTSNNNLFYNNYVGIGTNFPTEQLDVSGNIQLTGNLIPKTNIVSDLGSPTKRFRDLYLSGSTIDLSGALIKYDPITGGIKLSNYADNTLVGTFKDIITDGNVTVGGDLTVNGNFTTLDTQTVVVEDPIITLGGYQTLTLNDNKDRGIEFKYFDGSSKVGFFGFDNTTQNLVYLIDASNNNEVFTGTYGDIRANSFIGNNISVTSSSVIGNLNADLLDGQHGSYYNDWNNLTNKPNLVNTFNNRVGDVSLNATDISTALTYVPLDASTYTASDILSKLITVDGSGSQLDADYLDGQDSSFYRNASNINAGVLSVTYGGIGVNNLSTNKLLVGNGTNGILSPDSLTWNGYNLDVSGNISTNGTITGTNINFTGYLYQNGSPYIGSQWTDGSNNGLYYNLGNVGIGTSNPSQTLDISGTMIVNNFIVRNEWMIANDTPYTRTQLQLQPIIKTFKISSNNTSVFDVSLNGKFTITSPKEVHVYIDGIKLGYIDSNNNDYTVSINTFTTYTQFTITLQTGVNIDNIVDITIYPKFVSEAATKEPGYVYQVFNSPWDISNNKVFYNNGYVGIGTNNPQDRLDVSGNLLLRGNLIPGSNILYDIGSSTNRFRDLYLSGSTIDISGALIKYDPVTGGIKIANYADNTLVATFKDVIADGNVTVGGNLTVNGNFTTLDTQTVTVEDPIITLGGYQILNANDNKDRGIEFRYYDTTSKIGFFGYDNNTGNLVYLLDASNNSEIFTGTLGNIRASQFIGDTLNITSTGLVSNLNVDLLDGQHGSYYNDWNNLTNKPNLVNTFNNRVGDISLNATDISTALTYVPLNASIYTASDILSKLITVDGSGSQLDADFLDGYNSSYYRDATNINSGTLNVLYGGIGVNNLNSGKLLVGNGSNAILSPINLTWDGSNLGIGTVTPSQVLDVSGNINFSGYLYQNGSPYIGSQWDTSGNQIYYNGGNVGIGTSNPTQTLDISGSMIVNNFIVRDEWMIANDTPYTRTQLQIQGIQKTFIITDVSRNTFDISMNGRYYLESPSKVQVFINGVKLNYYDASNNDYAVNVNNQTTTTEFNISLVEPVVQGNVVDIIVYPRFLTNDATKEPGYVYQVFNSPWDISNNKVFYNTNYVGIGTSDPQERLDVCGNIIARGSITGNNIYFTGGLYQNGSPYIGSQWDTSGNQIYYNGGNVGIGSSNPSQILDVSGNINFTGNLYQNGVLFEGGGGAGQWVDGSNNKIYYNLGNVGIGTNNPTQTLDVSGDMIVNNFTVRNEWFVAQDTPYYRRQLQIQPINQTFIITSNGRTVFDISMNGQYTISSSQNVHVYVDGVKLGYYDVSKNDYSISINNQTQYTQFTITLNRAVNIGNIVEIYIYPKFITENELKQPGYVLQTINSPWDVSNNHAFYTVGNVGIGTNYPLANLDISGSFMLRGNFIDASENVKLYSIINYQSYTPIITASSINPVYTTPTFNFRYVRNGFKIDAEFVLECNLSYQGSGTYYISLPFPLFNSTASTLIGSGLYTVNGYNYNVYYMVDTGSSVMYVKMIDGLISSSHPHTNHAGAIIRFSGSIKYETAVSPVSIPESKFPIVMDTCGNVFINNKLRYLSSLSLNWVSYTPTIIAVSNPNFGVGGIINTKYVQLSKTVHYQGIIIPNSNGFSGGSGTYYIRLPFTANVINSQELVIGSASIKDSITNMTFTMNCVVYGTDPNYFYLVGTGIDNGRFSNTYPLDPITSNVTVSWNITYESIIAPYDVYQDQAQFLYLDNSSNLVLTKDVYDIHGNLKLLSTNVPRQDHTPSIYASVTNPTITVSSGGLYNMRYMRLYNTVIADFTIQFQIEQAGSGNYKFTLPLTPDISKIDSPLIGTGMLIITTPTIYRFTVSFMVDASGHVVILIPDTTMYFTHNHPLLLQQEYTVKIQGMISYETTQINVILPTGTNYALSMDVCGNILLNNEKKYLSGSNFNWKSYTPVISATVNPTLGTGANLIGRYTQIGKTVTYQGYVSFGAGFNPGSGNYYVSLPVPVYQFVNQDTSIGTGYIIDTDTATTYSMTCNVLGNDNQRFYITGGSVNQGILGANFPKTPLTNSVKFSWYITYEATIIPYDVPMASALSNAVVTDGNGNLGIGTNVLDKKFIINGDVKFGRGLYNGTSDGVLGGTFYKQESWDNPGATHIITYPNYCIGANSGGTLMIQVSNKNNSTPKVGNAMVSFIKSNTENVDIFIISTHSNAGLGIFSIANSGNNIIVTTDADCRIAWTSIGGY